MPLYPFFTSESLVYAPNLNKKFVALVLTLEAHWCNIKRIFWYIVSYNLSIIFRIIYKLHNMKQFFRISFRISYEPNVFRIDRYEKSVDELEDNLELRKQYQTKPQY